MAASQIPTISTIFFGKYVVQLPYRDKVSDCIGHALSRWKDNDSVPLEVDTLLRRYPQSRLRFFTFRPINLEKVEQDILDGRLSFEEKRYRPWTTAFRFLQLSDDPSMISFAVDYPPSLGDFRGTKPGSVILYREWFDFLSARTWSTLYDGRLDLCSKAQLIVEGPGTSKSPCSFHPEHTYESHVVKFATSHELDIHAHLENVHDDAVLQWPDSLCRIQRSYPPEPLPNGETIVCFPDYGVSLHGAWRNPQWSLTFSTLSDCVHQLVSAVEYLHFHRVAHLDIKPGNVALRVKPCTSQNCLEYDQDFPTHFHPYLTLIDLGSAELVTSPSELFSHTAGTSGCVAPEVQLYHRHTGLDGSTPPYDTASDSDMRPALEDYDSMMDSDTTAVDADCGLRKVSYNPSSADVWAVGHVLCCVSNIVTDDEHRRAIQELGECIMDQRPSAELVNDDTGTPVSLRTSALREMVEAMLPGRIKFSIGPAPERDGNLCVGPMTPLF